ncbi:MAG: hypothetical protein FVQ81_02075 [Candidatus Glassbacteria bacterium]|nr:hypothetical protein [Candidatus Glassbacteria bacterium]
MFGIYTDAALTVLVTAEGNMSNPDEETDLDGDAGETAILALWCGAIQSKLAAGIDDVVTTVTIDNAYFRFTDLPVIKCGTELMYVTAGLSPASTTLTVIRGWNNTTKAAHSLGDRVYMAYDGESITVACRDNEQVVTGDESGWLYYCLDNGSGSPTGTWILVQNLGDIDMADSVAFHRRVIVPASTGAVSKTDLIHDMEDIKLIALGS